jgi:hypothetical protein
MDLPLVQDFIDELKKLPPDERTEAILQLENGLPDLYAKARAESIERRQKERGSF